MEIFWTKEAIEDRWNLYDYIEERNPLAAMALDDLFSEQSARLVEYPLSGRVGRVPGTQETVVHENYMMVYDIVRNQIRILNVVHTARQWPPPSS
ncbi:hypothetical protein CEK62_14120 [Alcanivorax sp. N3-2A]|nr:hypothetical protein CEK62_14120 [Alcanivorax sp. N3-2A]|tara:strand:- start:34645 stop:34929 length:285 start_codon:yes stop_codon:yes gene_type:complete